MKRLIFALVALALLGLALPVAAQDYNVTTAYRGFPIQLCSSETGNPEPCEFLRFVPGRSLGLGNLQLLPSAAALYVWDSTENSFVRWDGASGSATLPGYTRLMDGDSTVLADTLDAFADNLATTLNGSMAASVMYGYDGATLDMIRTTAAGDALSATAPGLHTLGFNLFYDGSNYRRWQGITMADNLALPTAPFVGSVLLAYDGGTLDMVEVDGTGAVKMVDTSTRAGEDAGAGLRHVGLKATTEYDPAKTTTTGVVGAFSTVLGPLDVSAQRRCCVYLQNDAGDGDPFVDVEILFGPNTTDMPTVGDGAWTSCDSLADGEVCNYCWSDAQAAVEVQVKAAAADVDVDAWIHCTQ